MTQAPYPADTRAKGWRFELDYEQIEQSSTWALAGAEARPWLLMLWMTAWKAVPCGSLPADDEVVPALIGMPAKAWAKHRAVLLRGWEKADDGRLYHATLTARVMEMMSRRRSDSDRKARERMRKAEESIVSPGGVTRDSDVTPPGLPPESSTDNRQPTTNNRQPTKEKEEARKRAPACPDDVAAGVWADWLALRRAKKAPVSETTLAEARKESEKAAMPLEAFLCAWIARGSQGFAAEWIKPSARALPLSAVPSEPAWRTEQRERTAAFAGPAAAKPRPATVIEMEAPYAPSRVLG